MFMILNKKQCPTCGVLGEKWQRSPDVYMCPTCSTIFNEFGIVAQPDEDREELLS